MERVERATSKLNKQYLASVNKASLEGYISKNGNFKILDDGSIEANNGTFRGDIILANGGKVIGSDGLYSVLSYNTKSNLGQNGVNVGGSFNLIPEVLSLNINIPEDFTIEKAIIIVKQKRTYNHHIFYENLDGSVIVGEYGRLTNLNLYRYNSSTPEIISNNWDFLGIAVASGTKITSAFNNYTAPNYNELTITSADIKNELSVGMNSFYLSNGREKEFISDWSGTGKALLESRIRETCVAEATLLVYGYMKK